MLEQWLHKALHCRRVRLFTEERTLRERLQWVEKREAQAAWREVTLIRREEAVARREEEVAGREDAVRLREELVEERARGLEEGQVRCFSPLDGIHLHMCDDKRTAIVRVQISQPSVVMNGEQLCEHKAPVDCHV